MRFARKNQKKVEDLEKAGTSTTTIRAAQAKEKLAGSAFVGFFVPPVTVVWDSSRTMKLFFKMLFRIFRDTVRRF